jgi:hypothetical protein
MPKDIARIANDVSERTSTRFLCNGDVQTAKMAARSPARSARSPAALPDSATVQPEAVR